MNSMVLIVSLVLILWNISDAWVGREFNNDRRRISAGVTCNRPVSPSSNLGSSISMEETELSKVSHNQFNNSSIDIDTVMATYGMPWKSSSSSQNQHNNVTSVGNTPFYMPFFEWQLDFMKENLNNLQLIPTMDRSQTKDLTYAERIKGKGINASNNLRRMVTFCFSSDEYRLIRMTYLDGGNNTQVFTSLWYPRSTINLPLLGIDLLAFANRQQQRYLTVVDFQPIHKNDGEKNRDLPYEHLLKPIRDQSTSLQHAMSDRFYNESDGFFSSQMLLGKETTKIKPDNVTNDSNTFEVFSTDNNHYVWKDLWPAYQQYVRIHVNLVQQCFHSSAKNKTSQEEQAVLQGQKDYDDYSSIRDPAHGLLAATFGLQYADDFVYDVLFSLSDGAPNRTRGM